MGVLNSFWEPSSQWDVCFVEKRRTAESLLLTEHPSHAGATALEGAVVVALILFDIYRQFIHVVTTYIAE